MGARDGSGDDMGERGTQGEAVDKRAAAGALLGVVLLLAAGFAAVWLVGHGTSRFLEAVGRLDVDAFYDGRDQRPLVAMPAYWAVTVVYTLPVLAAAVAVPGTSLGSRPRAGRLARRASAVAGVVAAVCLLGIVGFAFDPARGGGHEPLIRRYEQFSYEAADLVFAAAWTSLTTAVLAVASLGLMTSLRWRLVMLLVVLAASGSLFAVLFT